MVALFITDTNRKSSSFHQLMNREAACGVSHTVKLVGALLEPPAHSCLILSESPAKKKHQKTQFCILGGRSSSSPEVVCHSRLHLKQSAFGRPWAQTQLVENTLSPLTYKVYTLAALIWLRDLSCPHLWDWRAHPGVALFKYTCSFIFFPLACYGLLCWWRNLLSCYRKPISQ